MVEASGKQLRPRRIAAADSTWRQRASFRFTGPCPIPSRRQYRPAVDEIEVAKALCQACQVHEACQQFALERVKAAVTVPVAVKLSPDFSSVGEVARRLDEAGADALVLFNRFMHPDIDPESLKVIPGFGLSTPAESRLPRTWISLLHGRLRASLGASTGVENPDDLAKYLLAGADVVMTTASLLRHGPQHATTLLDGLSDWMARKGFDSVGAFRGTLAVPRGIDETTRERCGYVSALREANASAYGPW